MTALPSPTPAIPATPVDVDEPFSVGVAYYRTDNELTFYLRALRHVRDSRLVLVVGLRDGARVPVDELPANARLILTAAGYADPDQSVGWYVPDPSRAVLVGMTGRHPDEGLILLFPADWAGPPPDALLEKARRWRSGPHSPEDDVHFRADHPN